jgi:hypothetical protein
MPPRYTPLGRVALGMRMHVRGQVLNDKYWNFHPQLRSTTTAELKANF